MPEPRYRRIADAIRADIAAGVLKPGDQLPSTSELRSTYGVGAGAVREAVFVLLGEGIIETRHGVGRYVKQPEQPDKPL